MENWSSSVADPFRVRIELDTNVLAYIVDKSYPSLTVLIELIQECPFVYEINISNYVLYEFVGIRKKEHFLRKVLEKNRPQNSTGHVNLSSLLKYKDSYSTPELDYFDAQNEIIESIQLDVETLTDVVGIRAKEDNIHNETFAIAKELYLNSKISKEDSLVLVSSFFQNKILSSDFFCLITNDGGFNTAYNDNKSLEKLDNVFNSKSLIKPHVEHISNKGNFLGINLKEKYDSNNIQTGFFNLIRELIISKNQDIYLGKTFSNSCGKNAEIICVQLELKKPKISVKYPLTLTIIDKNFNFIIHTHIPIKEFWDKNKVSKTTPFDFSNDTFEDAKFSFKYPSFPIDSKNKNSEIDIFKAIRETGNLVFIHPDSMD